MSTESVPKSVITCDLEGRIETYNEGAEALFGYTPDQVVGKKRVSLFSPGPVVLQHVPAWLETAREEGEFEGRTVFLRNDGSPFTADIRITPTFKNGEQIGYCGVSVPVADVPPEEAMPDISLGTRIFSALVVVRAPFLTATLVPVLIGAAWASVQQGVSPFPWGLFGLALFGALALHVAANVFNDYFDWKSGTDQANNDYFLPFSGGSRSVELGLVTTRGLMRVALAASYVAVACGVALFAMRGWPIVALGAAGLFAAFFYTAPPLRLAARKGLGELFVGLCFGPLAVGGTAYALGAPLSLEAFLAGVPVGLLTTAILWINEFPDAPSDASTGKNHLVVVLGKRAARWGYLALLAGAYLITVAGAVVGTFPMATLVVLLTLPLAVSAGRVLFAHWDDRELVAANRTTILLQLVAGLLFFAGLLLQGPLSRLIAA